MNIAFPLEKMTIKEKIILMEKIWEDLNKNNAVESPVWHKNILEKREKNVGMGLEKILDWDAEKNNIRNT